MTINTRPRGHVGADAARCKPAAATTSDDSTHATPRRSLNPYRSPAPDCHDLNMGVWDELNPEQTSVMIEAIHEAFLIHAMDAWRARQRWAETGTTLTPSALDDPTSWLLNLDGHHRVLELTTTDRWDQDLKSRL